ncbi:MAG: 5-oxoprolinase subunit PxpA [Chloroherpetonaceae bacterium]|nr:LamB/YcsF family protein [Chloroherpetonaceae bacterium]MCS7211502.1 LamB/YcsF family protein [Chloroherpetonaceae bacterium]MDW8020133.1 5-oxoprolinase subunit PxpA [Chloroherpetonaceae bacterium]MDW8467475.1 5-oxoprolinase subunit PxpA [Chloroherpetonaceae bacterium]
MRSIDLNADMGESFGAYTMGNDEALLEVVSSANIACGFHAGDPSVMRRTVRWALEKGVAIGAHPSLPDLMGFGRRAMAVSPEEVYDLTLYQLGALSAFVKAEGGRLQHLKPHGALYNMAAKQRPLADAIAKAVAQFDESLILVGLSGSELIAAGQAFGLRTASEVFADRTYQADGSLTPRTDAKALIDSVDEAVAQALRLATEGIVTTVQGTTLMLQADTICIHGDGANAVEVARAIRAALQAAGIEIRALAKREVVACER